MCNVATNHIQFENDLTLIGSVDGGVYFGTDDEITFAEGLTPKTYNFTPKADYGAIFGTMKNIKRPDVGSNEKMDNYIIFASKKGICIGQTNGDLINKTRANYEHDNFNSGAGLVRRVDGIDQYIVTLE